MWIAGPLALGIVGRAAFVAVVAVALTYPVVVFLAIFWQVALRPLAVSRGWVEPTAEDHLIRGWESERGGRWEDALAAYDEAARSAGWDRDAEARRAELLRRRPELATAAALQRLAVLDAIGALDYLGREATDRKLRLAAAACCRACHPSDDCIRRAVEAAEFYADRGAFVPGAIPAAEVGEVVGTWDVDPPEAIWADAVRLLISVPARQATLVVIRLTAAVLTRDEQVGLLLCIFSLPHQRYEADPTWLTSTVTAIAKGMYESRDFSAMPILADALEDAGCTDEGVLNHCRGGGPHVRGCWVVDLVLGKD
jgi:hypothetical protein